MTNPDQLQHDIEQTRASLSGNVDRLSEKVAPGKVLGRRVDNVKRGAGSLRDRVMGSAEDGSGVRGATSAVGNTMSDVGSAAQDAPAAARARTQGNPLAAGLIAFGAGMLLSSLAPATDAEKQLADAAESAAKEHAEPLKQAGESLVEDMKQPVQESVQQVKDTATQAAQDTTEHARSAAEDVAAPMQG